MSEHHVVCQLLDGKVNSLRERNGGAYIIHKQTHIHIYIYHTCDKIEIKLAEIAAAVAVAVTAEVGATTTQQALHPTYRS